MFWEKKDKMKGLPDLPRTSTRPSLPPEYLDDDFADEDIHELPSFPDSPMHKGFSQSAIKEAVANEDLKETEERPHIPYKTIEANEWTSPPQTHVSSSRRDSKPIFVRIDKFQLARDSLETVKTKLTEIEQLLKMIREVKAKEDTELSAWESEMESIKTRVQGVVNDIFDKTES